MLVASLVLKQEDKRPLLSTGWDKGEPCLPGSGGALCLEFQEIGEHGMIVAQSFPPSTFWYQIVAGCCSFSYYSLETRLCFLA